MESMPKIAFDELEEWYSQKINEKVKPYVAEASRIFNKVKDDLKHLIPISKDFVTGDPKAPEEANNAANRLGEKLLELIDELLKIPDTPTYNDVDEFIENSEKFYNQIMKYGRIWVPQLTKEFKPRLKRMDFFIKELQKKTFTFKKLQAKYGWIKQLESVFEKIKAIKKDLNTLNNYLEKKKELESILAEYDVKINEKKNKISQLRAAAHIDTIEEIDKELKQIEIEISQILNIYQKAFKKIINAMQSTKVKFSLNFQRKLNEYYENPVAAFLKEDIGYPELCEFLEELNRVLKEDSFSLKPQDVRRIEKKTKQIIKNKILLPYQKRYKELLEQKKNLSFKQEMNKITELNEELATLENEWKSIKFRLDELDHRISEKKEKIVSSKKALESLIRKNIGESVQVELALPS
ncbi:MAG: hypothetical protein ACP6IU_02755 [Candidatus Asgardarchaeia archaeon]